VALVNQDVVLFDDTIYNNIAYSKENATEEEVIKAATQAYCLDFIDNLPDGLQTHVGTRGMNLSGGQRQRISIARALLKSPPILLLDEATSSLDTESEKKIEQALHLLMQNKTTLVIAHRLSTIMNADKILVIDKGAIIESGTHQELLDENGFYKHLHDLQFKYYD
jgi:ABC-type multidrug transport system fused ATPase/permease subunit